MKNKYLRLQKQRMEAESLFTKIRLLLIMVIIIAAGADTAAQMVDPLTTLYQTAPDKFREDAIRIYDRALDEMELKIRAIEERAVKDSIVIEIDSLRMKLPFIYMLLEQERELAKESENAYELLPKGALYYAVDSLHQKVNALILQHNRSLSMNNRSGDTPTEEDATTDDTGNTISFDDLPDPQTGESDELSQSDETESDEDSAAIDTVSVTAASDGGEHEFSLLSVVLIVIPVVLFVILLVLLLRLKRRVDELDAANKKLTGITKQLSGKGTHDSGTEELKPELDKLNGEQKRLGTYFTEKIAAIEQSIAKLQSISSNADKPKSPEKISRSQLDDNKVTRGPLISDTSKFSAYKSADEEKDKEEQLHKLTVESDTPPPSKRTTSELSDDVDMAPSLYEEFNMAAVSGLNKQQFFLKKVKRFIQSTDKATGSILFKNDSTGEYFIGKDAAGAAEVFISFSYPFDRDEKREKLEKVYEVIIQPDLGRHIKITDPAIVELIDGQWVLQQKGRIIIGKSAKKKKGFTWR